MRMRTHGTALAMLGVLSSAALANDDVLEAVR